MTEYDRKQAARDPYSRPFALFTSHIGDYMRRYIFKHPWGTVRLHHILRSDNDRHLHDHPFDFTSILLTGGYHEVTQHRVWSSCCAADQEAWWYPRWSVVRRRATDLHRLVLERPVWTLCFTGPKVRSWGFLTQHGWVWHGDYEAYLRGSPQATPMTPGSDPGRAPVFRVPA